MTTWLITGCSSGLGRHLARAVLERGGNVVVTARNAASVQDIVDPYPDTATACALDVRDDAQVATAVRHAETRFGGVDVLVNNAGHGYRAAVEEGEEQEVAELFATNFHGPVALTKAVLPGMRARRSGAVVNVSSIAGRFAAPGSGYYAATKFALEGMSDALRQEVGPLGIKVIVAEPGAFRTDFAGRSLRQAHSAIADYSGTAGTRRKENDRTHGTQPGDPARGAHVLIDVVESPDPPFRLILGSDGVEGVRTELTAQLGELDTWAKMSVRSDFPA